MREKLVKVRGQSFVVNAQVGAEGASDFVGEEVLGAQADLRESATDFVVVGEIGSGDGELVLSTRLVAVRVLRGRVDDARHGREVSGDRRGEVAVDIRRGDDRQALGRGSGRVFLGASR